MDYEQMNTRQRAEYLLAKGVVAKLEIDPDAMKPGYAAHVVNIGKLPCGYHETEQAAVDAGADWLHAKARA